MEADHEASVSAIGRLGPEAAPWFGIARVGERFRLAFGEADGRLTYASTADPARSRRDLLLALAAFFEADSGEPPAELEATQSDVAAALRWLLDAARADREPGLVARLEGALDAIDDGMPPDVVVQHLYEAMSAVAPGRRPRPVVRTLEELLERYRSIEG